MSSKVRMPYMLPAGNTLRRKIGCDISLEEVFTPEKIVQCQEIVNNAHAEALSAMKAEVDRLSEVFVSAAEDPVKAAVVLKEGSVQVLAIKKKMEELGFSFGFEVARSLHEYLHATRAYSSDVVVVVCKHIAVLNIILRESITGDGGRLGREMLANLRKLVRKVES